MIRMASWSISVDEPLMLLVALYVRDVAGLRPPLEYDVPPLDPPVLRESGGTDDDGSNQWAVWWQELLRGGGMWPAYADPAKMSELREDPDIQRLFYWPGRYAPPDFPSLHSSPELHRDVRRHHQAALAWAEARKLEFFALTTARGHHRIEWEVVKLEERHIGRTVRPFNLDLRVLPLAEPWAWRLAPDRALMSLSMCRDRAAYRSWLTAVVRELA